MNLMPVCAQIPLMSKKALARPPQDKSTNQWKNQWFMRLFFTLTTMSALGKFWKKILLVTVLGINDLREISYGQSAANIAPSDVADENEDDADEDVQEDTPTVRSSQTKKNPARNRQNLQQDQAEEGEEMRVASASHVRRFHEVLDEILAEFGYDIKMGEIKGLSNMAIRKVRVSQAIPRTYEEYIETLLAERIRENSKVRMIACVPCKTRTSSLVDGKIMITSPATNMAKLDSAAAMLGINFFMDAVLVYHTTHMVLAVDVFNTQTKELVWARSYNSETIKSRYQKLAIDYSQVARSRPGEDYEPEYRTMIGIGAGVLPNLSTNNRDDSMLNLQIRGTEKFSNRKNEFGMLLSIFQTSKSTLSDYPTEENSPPEGDSPTSTPSPTPSTPQPKAYNTALAIYGIYSRVMVGSVESYNEVRHGLNVGLGGLFATGYIAPVFRGAWDIFLGRRFVTSAGLDFVGSSSVVVKGKSIPTQGGLGGHVLLSLTY